MTFSEPIQNGVPVLTADLLTQAGGVCHGFSSRRGGVSQGIYASLNLGADRGDEPGAVTENYRRFCAAIGVTPQSLVFSNQVHGSQVRVVTTADVGCGLARSVPYEADGLITDVPGVTLTVFSADCLPILLYDPVRRVVAAVHCGWRGTALGTVKCCVEKMQAVYGCQPADLLAAIGPGISKCCFETHEDVPNAMTEALGAGALKHIEVLPSGKFKVDLKGLNALRLALLGLDAGHIAVSDRCTSCLHQDYWSHRVTQGQRGSQAAMIQLCPSRAL